MKEKKGLTDAVTVFFEDTRDGKDGERGTIGGDILLAADGPSSTIRHKLQPGAERKYCGYVALRGTIPESELDESIKKTLVETFTFFHTEGIQILSYVSLTALVDIVSDSDELQLYNTRKERHTKSRRTSTQLGLVPKLPPRLALIRHAHDRQKWN